MSSSPSFLTEVRSDSAEWEFDFRDEIAETSNRETIPTLKQGLNRLVGRPPDAHVSLKSMNAFCPVVSSAIPNSYGIHDENSSAGKKATGLRRFLTDQLG